MDGPLPVKALASSASKLPRQLASSIEKVCKCEDVCRLARFPDRRFYEFYQLPDDGMFASCRSQTFDEQVVILPASVVKLENWRCKDETSMPRLSILKEDYHLAAAFCSCCPAVLVQ